MGINAYAQYRRSLAEQAEQPFDVGGVPKKKSSSEVQGHATLINNLRLMDLLKATDGYGITARQSRDFYALHDYYSSLFELKLNLTGAIKNIRKLDDLCVSFEAVEDSVSANGGMASFSDIKMMLTLCEQLKAGLVWGLIEIGFFFKMAEFEKKGFGVVDSFSEDSIFASKKKKKGGLL